MLIAVDINATFNTIGDIKPLYIRLEDSNHKLHVYKIIDVKKKEIKQNGLHNYITFTCSIECNEETRLIKINYHPNSNKWILIDL